MPVSDDELRALAEARGIAPDDWKELARTLLAESKPAKPGRPKTSREDFLLWTLYALETNAYATEQNDPMAMGNLPPGKVSREICERIGVDPRQMRHAMKRMPSFRELMEEHPDFREWLREKLKPSK